MKTMFKCHDTNFNCCQGRDCPEARRPPMRAQDAWLGLALVVVCWAVVIAAWLVGRSVAQ